MPCSAEFSTSHFRDRTHFTVKFAFPLMCDPIQTDSCFYSGGSSSKLRRRYLGFQNAVTKPIWIAISAHKVAWNIPTSKDWRSTIWTLNIQHPHTTEHKGRYRDGLVIRLWYTVGHAWLTMEGRIWFVTHRVTQVQFTEVMPFCTITLTINQEQHTTPTMLQVTHESSVIRVQTYEYSLGVSRSRVQVYIQKFPDWVITR